MVVGDALVVLAGDLDPGRQAVRQAEGVEVGTQVGLVDPQFAVDVTTVGLGAGRFVVARRHAGGVGVGGGDHRVAIDLAVTGQVLQAEAVVEAVLQLDGKGIGFDLVLVQVAETEVVVTVDTGELLAITGRHAVIGQDVIALVEVAQGQARILAQAQGQGRRETPALAVDLVTAGYIIFMQHQVEAHGAVGADAIQGLVAVQGQAVVVVGTQAAADAGEIAAQRLLGDLVDAAAGGAAAAEHRIGALDDFHRLDVEGVGAVGLGAVAQAIDLHVGVGAEAADIDAVARATTALAGGEGDAGDIRQHLTQAQGLLFFDHLLRHHADGLRGIEQRRGVLGRRRGGGLVALGLRAGNGDAVQLNRALGRLARGLFGDRDCGPGSHGQADGGGQELTLRQTGRLDRRCTHENKPPIKTRRDSI